MMQMMTPAYINRIDGKDRVVKSVQTVLSQIYLNKLWIPDVLIDIIKDYLYVSAEEILRKFHRSCINTSINQLSGDCYYLVDFYERRRQVHWSIGHAYGLPSENPVQMQQIMCVTCGERSDYHTNFDGCCVMEWDGEDGTMDLSIERTVIDFDPNDAHWSNMSQPLVLYDDSDQGQTEVEEEKEEDKEGKGQKEEEEEVEEEYYSQDGYDSDDWYAGDRRGAHSRK